FHFVDAVFKRIADTHSLVRKLSFLADRNEAGRNLMRNRTAQNKAARLYAGDLVDLHPRPGLHQFIHRTTESACVAKEGSDVAEHDSGLGIVGNRPDRRAQVTLEGVGSHRLTSLPGNQRRGVSRLSS